MATRTATTTPLQHADELLREMTLEEKAMQLSCFTSLALFGPDGRCAASSTACSRTASVALPLSVLAYTGITGDVVMEPGPIELSAGSSSDDVRSTAAFTATGETRVMRGEERAFLSVATVSA